MPSFAFTKVVIVESLNKDEFKSGTELCKFIKGLKGSYPDVPSADLVEENGSSDLPFWIEGSPPFL